VLAGGQGVWQTTVVVGPRSSGQPSPLCNILPGDRDIRWDGHFDNYIPVNHQITKFHKPIIDYGKKSSLTSHNTVQYNYTRHHTAQYESIRNFCLTRNWGEILHRNTLLQKLREAQTRLEQSCYQQTMPFNYILNFASNKYSKVGTTVKTN